MNGLNTLSDRELRDVLRRCCGSTRWVECMASRRPWADVAALLRDAEAAWRQLSDSDWAEAFDAAAERSIPPADAGTQAAAALALRLYRERFGRTYVASQRMDSADELLMRVRIRLGYDDGAELRTARSEQRRLTRRCLQLLAEDAPARADGAARVPGHGTID